MMEPSFEKLLVVLADAKVDFVLVGGLAVTLQGYVRFTEDVDILIDSNAENVARLLEALAGYGEGFARELRLEDFTEDEGAIRIVEEAEQCQIDIFTVMSGRVFADVIEDADVFSIHGREIHYASKTSLIGWKEKSVREKDRLDAMALRRLEEDPAAFD
jgi:Nucleotidyl transferase of unknown function (DUF2204)